MSDQFNRDIIDEEAGRTTAHHGATRSELQERRPRGPSFTVGDMVAFGLVLVMIWGPLAMGALRA